MKTKKTQSFPLAGKKILITRALDQSAEFAESLRNLGAEVIEFPTIQIVPPLRWEGLDRTLTQLKSYDWVIFTSVNGVHFFWQRWSDLSQDRLFPSALKVCAIGPATANRLREKGIHVDYTPREFVAESVLRGFKKMAVQGKRILLARARVARDILPKGLQEMGATVEVVETYRTVKPRGGARKLKQLFTGGPMDVVTFTSSSTVTHFVELLGKENLKKLLKKTTIACIGPITSRTAKEWGMNVSIQPREYTIPALTQAIVQYFTER